MASLLLVIVLFNLRATSVFGEYNNQYVMAHAGRRIKETSNVERQTGVSEIQCMYGCLSSGRCCVVSYSPSIKACLIDLSDMCCPETKDDINWNIWIKSSNLDENQPGSYTVQKAIDCGDVDGDSGVYTIYGICPMIGFDVLCDMHTDGGGWTVFQKRWNGEIDFYLGWSEYEDGFGDLRKEFWIGNKHLNEITSQNSYVLRVDLEDFENRTRYAQYETFYVGDSTEKYKITVANYSGDAGDSMAFSNGMAFTTKDQDNDNSSLQCAQQYKGGWWYSSCHYANLNGLYLGGPHTSHADGIEWNTWKGHFYSLKSVKMMIRRH